MLTEGQDRLFGEFYQDLGEKVVSLLADNDIREIMLNPDGSLWVESATEGMREAGRLSSVHALAILNKASLLLKTDEDSKLCFEVELPYYRELHGARLLAQLPPIVSSPCFTLRKRNDVIYTLDDYLFTERVTETQYHVLKELIARCKNILIGGLARCGKTTLLNTLINESVSQDPGHRWIILEDFPEINCTAPNQLSLVTTDKIPIGSLLRRAISLRADRLALGEIHGSEALGLIEAWNSGGMSGMSTLYAKTASDVIKSLLDCSLESRSPLPLSLIKRNLHAIVMVSKMGKSQGFVSDISIIKDIHHGKVVLDKIA